MVDAGSLADGWAFGVRVELCSWHWSSVGIIPKLLSCSGGVESHCLGARWLVWIWIGAGTRFSLDLWVWVCIDIHAGMCLGCNWSVVGETVDRNRRRHWSSLITHVWEILPSIGWQWLSCSSDPCVPPLWLRRGHDVWIGPSHRRPSWRNRSINRGGRLLPRFWLYYNLIRVSRVGHHKVSFVEEIT